MAVRSSDDGRALAGAPPAGELFNKVSVGRISQVIVEQIRGLIRRGALKPGDRLPSERELCEKFGVSRVTVREALRVLESTGLIEIRVGARGGAFARAPSSDRVGEGLADLLSTDAMSSSDVTEARQVLEVGLVPLACRRADEADLETLAEICDRSEEALRRGEYRLSLSAEFHLGVAQATHNAAIVMLVESFRRPLLGSLQEAHDADPRMDSLGVKDHRQFLNALRAGDVERSVKIMERHLVRTVRRLR